MDCDELFKEKENDKLRERLCKIWREIPTDHCVACYLDGKKIKIQEDPQVATQYEALARNARIPSIRNLWFILIKSNGKPVLTVGRDFNGWTAFKVLGHNIIVMEKSSGP